MPSTDPDPHRNHLSSPQYAQHADLFHLSKGMQSFVGTLQFHYMGFGAGFAWLLHKHRNRLLALPIFRSPALQWLCLLLIGEFFFFYQKECVGELLYPFPLACLFGWLIINISSNPGRILHLDSRPLNYLGKISYGLYMYHMPVVYAIAFLFKKMAWTDATGWFYFPAYFTLGVCPDGRSRERELLCAGETAVTLFKTISINFRIQNDF